MINCVITTDWEVISPSKDGSIKIDIGNDMLKNAIKLMNVADKHNVKITYFLEVIEWYRFNATQYQARELEELNQLIVALHKNGHDVQIHAHSEWVTARLIDHSWYRAFAGPDQIHSIIQDFLRTFDESISSLKFLLGESWAPLVFRAGAYRIDPVKELFPSLLDRGIKADMSRHFDGPCTPFKLENLLEIPITGKFPTASERWDMNLGPESMDYLHKYLDTHYPSNNYQVATMMGHTKMATDWKALDRLFYVLSNDDRTKVSAASNFCRMEYFKC